MTKLGDGHVRGHISPRQYEENRRRALTPQQRAKEQTQVLGTQRRIAHGLWVLKVEGWFLDSMRAAAAGQPLPSMPWRFAIIEELHQAAARQCGWPPTPDLLESIPRAGRAGSGEDTAWPPFPAGADFEALRRYAGTRIVAEVLRSGEEQDLALFGAEIAPLTDPAQLWEKAQRIYDEETRLQQHLAPLRVVEQRGGEPAPIHEALARMEANFGTAREACRTGHSGDEGPTCTYGGLTPTSGYWLAADICQQNHGETCQLRAVCAGAPAETQFAGWGNGFIWGVCACQGCAEALRQVHPEWRAA